MSNETLRCKVDGQNHSSDEPDNTIPRTELLLMMMTCLNNPQQPASTYIHHFITNASPGDHYFFFSSKKGKCHKYLIQLLHHLFVDGNGLASLLSIPGSAELFLLIEQTTIQKDGIRLGRVLRNLLIVIADRMSAFCLRFE